MFVFLDLKLRNIKKYIKRTALLVIIGIPLLWILLICSLIMYHGVDKFSEKVYEDYQNTIDYLDKLDSKPGEHGVPHNLDFRQMDNKEMDKFEKGWKLFGFNEMGSSQISYTRQLPDIREPPCLDIIYPRRLPTTSIVIVFHNEARSTLMRTLHSLLDRSPTRLLQEVILVDDASDMDHLGHDLELYIKENLPPFVKLLRQTSRQGIVRARLLGASAAVAEVITFLDSHVECTEGWLEPLLHRVLLNKRSVVSPFIDQIEDSTFEYIAYKHKYYPIGGFTWELEFDWHISPNRDRNNTSIAPITSPALSGGLFSINREFFFNIGSYDIDMQIWGFENIELSLRIWMCGGIIEFIPCSHVGHLFRQRSPALKNSDSNIFKRNARRVAEVWLDDHKKYFYERTNNYQVDYGDISDRVNLRKHLKCKSFQWYLDTVYPELFVPDNSTRARGDIRNSDIHVCIDANTMSMHSVQAWPCHSKADRQLWFLSDIGNIRRDGRCFEYKENLFFINYCGNSTSQIWIYKENMEIVHVASGKCLDLISIHEVGVRKCSGDDNQKWTWNRT